jgi:transcription-repair coupling factor (superfamily II helicase)
LHQLRTELADVYGPLPAEVGLLIDITELRIAAGQLGIKGIVAHSGNLVFSYGNEAGKYAKKLFSERSPKDKKIAQRHTVADDQTVYLHLSAAYFEQQTLLSFLRKLLGVKKQ